MRSPQGPASPRFTRPSRQTSTPQPCSWQTSRVLPAPLNRPSMQSTPSMPVTTSISPTTQRPPNTPTRSSTPAPTLLRTAQRPSMRTSSPTTAPSPSCSSPFPCPSSRATTSLPGCLPRPTPRSKAASLSGLTTCPPRSSSTLTRTATSARPGLTTPSRCSSPEGTTRASSTPS